MRCICMLRAQMLRAAGRGIHAHLNTRSVQPKVQPATACTAQKPQIKAGAGRRARCSPQTARELIFVLAQQASANAGSGMSVTVFHDVVAY